MDVFSLIFRDSGTLTRPLPVVRTFVSSVYALVCLSSPPPPVQSIEIDVDQAKLLAEKVSTSANSVLGTNTKALFCAHTNGRRDTRVSLSVFVDADIHGLAAVVWRTCARVWGKYLRGMCVIVCSVYLCRSHRERCGIDTQTRWNTLRNRQGWILLPQCDASVLDRSLLLLAS